MGVELNFQSLCAQYRCSGRIKNPLEVLKKPLTKLSVHSSDMLDIVSNMLKISRTLVPGTMKWWKEPWKYLKAWASNILNSEKKIFSLYLQILITNKKLLSNPWRFWVSLPLVTYIYISWCSRCSTTWLPFPGNACYIVTPRAPQNNFLSISHLIFFVKKANFLFILICNKKAKSYYV